jgi:hypothetical protein
MSSSFKVTITLESSLSSQELADFFSALAKSEQGDVQPLIRILHPVEPPPPPPVPEPEPVPAPAPAPVAPTPPGKNTQWERCNIILTDEESMDRITREIESGELASPSTSFTWNGVKHSPRSQHNRRIFDALRASPNRTMSFTSLGAQAGIPDKDKLKSYLREMEKQGFISAMRRQTL